MKNISFVLLLSCLLSCGVSQTKHPGFSGSSEITDTINYTEEKHFRNLRQLTFGGDNAEAYFSFDGSKLVFQATNTAWNASCDQIFYFNYNKDNLKTKTPAIVSTGKGRTTCSYFMPGDKSIIYASTHIADARCPKHPERREDGKYVWPIYDSFDIFLSDLQGNIIKQLTNEPGYDAEATVSPKGDKIVFTSMRTGDLELFTMNIDGSGLKQITSELGYDGGAFFSPDGTKLIFRASRPKTEEDIHNYKKLLSEGLVMPTSMELFICNADGSDLRQLTHLGKANWSPYFHPSGKKVLFSSNHQSARGYQFNLFMINIDGTGLTKVSYDNTFDAFPVFSPNGKKLVFSSNRNNKGTRDTNLFIADWAD
jgi:TolB protein